MHIKSYNRGGLVHYKVTDSLGAMSSESVRRNSEPFGMNTGGYTDIVNMLPLKLALSSAMENRRRNSFSSVYKPTYGLGGVETGMQTVTFVAGIKLKPILKKGRLGNHYNRSNFNISPTNTAKTGMSPTRKVSFDNEVEVVEFSQKDSEAVSVKKRIMDGLGCLDFNNGSRTLTNYRSSRCRKPVVEYLISSDSDKDVPETIALSSHSTSNECGSSKDGLNGRHSDWNYGNLGYLSEKSTTIQKTKGAKADVSATIEKKTITSPIENRYRSISSSGSRNIKWGKPQQVQNSLRTIQVIRGPQYAQSGLSMIGLNQEVELQSINYDKDMNVLYGNIMVKNICFEKSVVIRYTTNNWEESSIREVNAKYNTSLTSNGSDLFLYVLDLNEIQQNNSISGLRSGGGVGGGYVTSTIDLEFCIRYRAGQCVANEFWDNNNNQNYFVRVFTFPQ